MPITTLLFDLDDTLLGNSMDTFIPAYLRLLAGHVEAVVPPQLLVKELLAGTQAMIENADPRCTLKQTFNDRFFPAIAVPAEKIKPQIETFYANHFGSLRGLTTPRPAAREIMQWAFASGLKVGIATNALFPRTAILQRLEWAGVSADEFPYALVTSYEFMHFAKPMPEYFAEALAWLDCRPEEVLMIGDDWARDIVPASQVGVNTFWIAPANARPPAGSNHAQPACRGTLSDFLEWAAADNCLYTLRPLPAAPRAVRAQQAASPAVMMKMTSDLAQEQWLYRPGESEWSLAEIACHLRDVENEINLPRLMRLLEESNPFISAVDSDQWAKSRSYQSQHGPTALADFLDARRQTLALFDQLSPDDWQRPARHAIFGPTTLQELATFTVEHDRLHLRQMRGNLKSDVRG